MSEVVHKRVIGIEIIPTILGIILIFFIGADYFVQGGIPAVATVRGWFMFSTPFSLAVVTITMVIAHLRNIANRAQRWYYSAITIGTLVVMLAIGYSELPWAESALYKQIFDSTFVAGSVAVIGMVTFSQIAAFYRIYLVRSALTALLVGTTIFALLYYSPLGGMVLGPLFAQFGDWVSGSLVAEADAVFWLAEYIGSIALLARIIVLRESLKARG